MVCVGFVTSDIFYDIYLLFHRHILSYYLVISGIPQLAPTEMAPELSGIWAIRPVMHMPVTCTKAYFFF